MAERIRAWVADELGDPDGTSEGIGSLTFIDERPVGSA